MLCLCHIHWWWLDQPDSNNSQHVSNSKMYRTLLSYLDAVFTKFLSALGSHITVLNNFLDIWNQDQRKQRYIFSWNMSHQKCQKVFWHAAMHFNGISFFMFCNSAIESWCFWQICYCTILLARYFLEV